MSLDNYASSSSDPIADLRRGIDLIKGQFGSRPNCILVSAWLPQRMLESLKAKLERARYVLGIGRSDGILWSARGGRRSKMRRRYLRELETLPGEIARLERVVASDDPIGSLFGAQP